MMFFQGISPVDPDIKSHIPKKSLRNSIALVASRDGCGVVLDHYGEDISFYIDGVGFRTDDLEIDDAPEGLSIWEGKICTYRSMESLYDDDCSLEGEFRPLTDEEWARVKRGERPWAIEKRNSDDEIG